MLIMTLLHNIRLS